MAVPIYSVCSPASSVSQCQESWNPAVEGTDLILEPMEMPRAWTAVENNPGLDLGGE